MGGELGTIEPGVRPPASSHPWGRARRRGRPRPVAYPTQEGFVDAGGVFLYYLSIGKGRPLVIVHGGPGASHDQTAMFLQAVDEFLGSPPSLPGVH